MDRYSYEVRHWLDLRYDAERLGRIGHDYSPYQPILGIADGAWNNGTVSMAGRMARLCADIESLGARSLLDVGGAEGLVAETTRRVTGIEVVSSDLSLAASRRAHHVFDLPALACEADRLPFADGAFDVVYCGEVIEHLARPIEALLELARVA
ncbi:MAG: class I SAM-dependent methyltransferase, partial [Planctomycetota bacterium]